jgi:hypothetical protein
MGLRHFWHQGGKRSHHHQAGEKYGFHLVHPASPEMGRTSRLRFAALQMRRKLTFRFVRVAAHPE